MDHRDALSLFTGSYCLQIHSVRADPVRTEVEPRLRDDDMATWLVEGSHFFTILSTYHGTRIYDHATDCLHFASPETELRPGCPPDHAFLAQTVQDEGSEPRLLVFDLVYPINEDPRGRNEVLRSLQSFFPPACSLQWSGKASALRQFIEKEKLPHRVKGLVGLRRPLELVLEGKPMILSDEVLKMKHMS